MSPTMLLLRLLPTLLAVAHAVTDDQIRSAVLMGNMYLARHYLTDVAALNWDHTADVMIETALAEPQWDITNTIVQEFTDRLDIPRLQSILEVVMMKRTIRPSGMLTDPETIIRFLRSLLSGELRPARTTALDQTYSNSVIRERKKRERCDMLPSFAAAHPSFYSAMRRRTLESATHQGQRIVFPDDLNGSRSRHSGHCEHCD